MTASAAALCMPNIKRLARAAVKRILPRKPSDIESFFALPYDARVAEVKRLYRHEVKKRYIGDWYTQDIDKIRDGLRSQRRPYFDIILGYAKTLKPASIMQLGSYAMVEGIWLTLGGYKGRIIASDFDVRHLDYLRQSFSGTFFERTEFRVVDLEIPTAENFSDVSMVVAVAVLSNIQPEGMERLLKIIGQSDVQCVIIGDMYTSESLTTHLADANRSIPFPSVRNWCHPYMALAKKHGLEAFFLPDFTYSSFEEARGIFVIHRNIPVSSHLDAIRDAMCDYIERQDCIWPTLMADCHSDKEREGR